MKECGTRIEAVFQIAVPMRRVAAAAVQKTGNGHSPSCIATYFICVLRSSPPSQSTLENRNTVSWLHTWPGRRTHWGKSG